MQMQVHSLAVSGVNFDSIIFIYTSTSFKKKKEKNEKKCNIKVRDALHLIYQKSNKTTQN